MSSSCPEPVEQVLPGQRAEGDDQARCAENVRSTIIVFVLILHTEHPKAGRCSHEVFPSSPSPPVPQVSRDSLLPGRRREGQADGHSLLLRQRK